MWDFVLGSAVVAGGLLASSVAWLNARRRHRTALAALRDCQARRQDLVRLLRLTASELRGPALNLLGLAEQLPAPHKATLTGACRGLLDIAEDILDQTDDPSLRRHLREEEIAIGPLLDFVVAQVAAQLGPGRRAWHIAPGLDAVVLRADRRALHQVLLRVLTGAALATRQGDRIDIASLTADGQWALQVEDEGAGLAVPQVKGKGLETRGLGLGLSLARSLMQAHGGGLAMQSASLVGTRALLSFPLERVVTGV